MMEKFIKEPADQRPSKDDDSTIDYSDIPELDEKFWAIAELLISDEKEATRLQLDSEVVHYFKKTGKGYQTKINNILKSYIISKEIL